MENLWTQGIKYFALHLSQKQWATFSQCRERFLEVYTKFLTHLSHSQIAPITVDAVDQVTDLQSILTGTNAFEQGRALCWLKSFVFDPKKQVIFGDRNTKLADRRKHMQEFAERLKLRKCQ